MWQCGEMPSFQPCKAPASFRHQQILEMLYNLPVIGNLPRESKRDFHKFKLAIPFIEKTGKKNWKKRGQEYHLKFGTQKLTCIVLRICIVWHSPFDLY